MQEAKAVALEDEPMKKAGSHELRDAIERSRKKKERGGGHITNRAKDTINKRRAQKKARRQQRGR